jgi:myo-inositol-1(or 4)-monophosphatase
LALEHAGQLMVGAVYDPSADTCFTGVRGQGAYCNGVRLQTSAVTRLADALVSAGFPAEVLRDSPDLRLFNEAVLVCQSMRRTGSLALNLAYLAAGRFDVVWSCTARLWDVAAGMLLIQEAGGLATSLDGNAFPLAHGPFLATANATLHQQMVALVRRTGLATG